MKFIKRYIEKGVVKLTLIDALNALRTQLKELKPIDENNCCTIEMFNYAVEFFKIIASFQNNHDFDIKAFRYHSSGELSTEGTQSIYHLNNHDLEHLKTRYNYDITDLQCRNRRDVLKKLAEIIDKYGYKTPETAPNTYEKRDKTNKTRVFFLIDTPGTEVSWRNVYYCGERLDRRIMQHVNGDAKVVRKALERDVECARQQLLFFLDCVLDDLYFKPRNPLVLRAYEKGSR